MLTAIVNSALLSVGERAKSVWQIRTAFELAITSYYLQNIRFCAFWNQRGGLSLDAATDMALGC
jgi:hypothetical protein